MHKLSIIFLTFAMLVSACSPLAADSTKTAPVIVASTTFLADIAQNVAGDRLQVESLLPVGADAHSYQPIPQDVARIADSELLIVNGAEYEHFLEDIIQSAGGERTVVEVSAGLSLRKDSEIAHGVDPHLWSIFWGRRFLCLELIVLQPAPDVPLKDIGCRFRPDRARQTL